MSLRLAYLVDGRMAAGLTGSGHHIRSFFGCLPERGVEAACFDSLCGRRLDPFPPPLYEPPGLVVRARGLARGWLSQVEPPALRGARERRKARAYLRMAGEFDARAFGDLTAFRPDFLLGRMSHANTFAFHASERTGAPYGLECNAPVRYQEGRFGTLVEEEECERRERRLLGGARFVTYVSEATRDICHRSPWFRDVPSCIVRNCAGTAFFEAGRHSPSREAVRRELGVSSEQTLAIYVGSFKRWHRVDVLVAAAVALTEADIKILLVGWGKEAFRVRAQVRRAGLEERVIMMGAVAHVDVPAYVAAADVGVQPGANAYSAPLKLIEYMATGLATIAPRVPPIEEVLEHDTNAWLLDDPNAATLADALVLMHEDPALRRRLALRAREDVRSLTWSANAAQVVETVNRHRAPRTDP